MRPIALSALYFSTQFFFVYITMKRGYNFHGKTYTKIYYIWYNIKHRCYKKVNKNYKDYGGRGIIMQEDWINDLFKFEEYIESLNGYSSELVGNGGISLDRINNDGNYEEGNLRWASEQTQKRNRRIPCTNKTGFMGVSFHKLAKKYRARITVDKREIYLGIKETAIEAYQLRIDYIKKHNLKEFKI
mgnify:FL=1